MEVRDVIQPKRKPRPRAVFSLSDAEKEKLKKALIDMYKDWPGVDDPVIKAELTIQRCCNATNDKGQPWSNAPHKFADRLKACGFDYDSFQPIPGFYSRNTRLLEGATLATKAMPLPKELKNRDAKNAVASGSFLNSGELKLAQKKLNQILKDFPELNNKTDQETAMLLAKFYVVAERIMNRALETGTLPKSNNIDMIISSNIERLQKLLGIDRPSRNKARSETEEGTVAQLVRDYEAYVDEGFYENEIIWKIEELSLLLRKYDREDETGAREIDEVVFESLSGGISIEQARELVKNPYYDKVADVMEQMKKDATAKKEKTKEEAQKMRKLFFDVPKKRRKSFRKLLAVEGWAKNDIRKICSPKKKLASLAKKKDEDTTK